MLKVLFVSSGNSKFGISPIVKSQGQSLEREGIDLEYFTILGKGTRGYLKNIPRLRKYLKTHNYHFIHAHYSLSAIVASLSCRLPMVVSLMGSDTHIGFLMKSIIKFFCIFRWNVTIVKSEKMKKSLSFDNAIVIPNGVDFNLFKPIDQDTAKIKVGFNDREKHIIFVANPERPEKYYSLAERAIELLNKKSVKLNVVSDIEQKIIPYYMNAADLLLLTSLREGSSNVIKEAMACNCQIVSTDVGDVKEVIGNTEGCYICSYNLQDVTEKIKKALEFGKRTDGREKITHLNEKIIAQKIIGIYNIVLKRLTVKNIAYRDGN